MKLSKGGGGVTKDPQKGDNDGKIQAMGSYNDFIAHQVTLLGVSDHFVRKNVSPVPMNIYISKSYGLDSISCTEFVRVIG